MRRVEVLIAVGLALMSAPAALAEDYEKRVKLRWGSVIELTVERTRLTTQGGKTTGADATVVSRYRQEFAPTRQGYRVTQLTIAHELKGGRIDETKALETLGSRIPDLVYDASDDLSPVRIAEWAQTVSALLRSPEPRTGATAKVVGMTPEQGAAAMLADQALAALAQNVDLDLKRPIRAQVQVEPPWGGPPIAGTFEIELVELDEAAGHAVILTKEALDPDAAAQGAKALVQARLDQASSLKRPTEAQLAAFRPERTTGCRHRIDLKTGLASRIECTTVSTTLDETLAPAAQSERRVMTQVLVRR